MPAFSLRDASQSHKAGRLLGWLARGILIAVTAFWLFFCIADGLSDARELGIIGFIMMLPAALITLAALYIVLRWEYAGAFVLLGISLLGSYFVQQNMQRSHLSDDARPAQLMLLLLVMVLPFLIPGVLLFIKRWLERGSMPG